MTMKPNRGRIESWCIYAGMVWGKMEGRHPDPSIGAGSIRTSRIVNIDAREGGQVETLNSIYDLGKPSPHGIGEWPPK